MPVRGGPDDLKANAQVEDRHGPVLGSSRRSPHMLYMRVSPNWGYLIGGPQNKDFKSFGVYIGGPLIWGNYHMLFLAVGRLSRGGWVLADTVGQEYIGLKRVLGQGIFDLCGRFSQRLGCVQMN